MQLDAPTSALLAQYNPWILDPGLRPEALAARLSAPWIERRARPRLAAEIARIDRAHLVVGPRQAGKSSLVWSVLAAQTAPGPLLFLNAEEPLFRQLCASPGAFAAQLEAVLPRGGTLFIDEAQRLAEAGLFLKGLVDLRLGWSIVVTGSASFHLLSKTRESLAGRASRHAVWPLDLAEAAAVPDARGLHAVRRREALDRLLVFGGYPAVWNAADPAAELTEILSAFVLRDASDLFEIEHPAAFRRVLELAAGQAGDLVNVSEWAQVTQLSAHTVDRYLDLMAETHVIARARPYIGGKRAELTKMSKVFFVDNGLRNAVRGGFGALDHRGDLGRLMENWVFSELHKRWPAPGLVRYWRTKGGAEADFVVEARSGARFAFEVKAGGGRPALSRGARSFVEAYAPQTFFVVTRGDAHRDRIGATEVRWLPAHDLPETLMEIDA